MLQVISYEFGPFRLELDEHRLLRNGQTLALPPKAMDALGVLVKNHGKLLERQELINAVWSDELPADEYDSCIRSGQLIRLPWAESGVE